jgi:hypothetical protein
MLQTKRSKGSTIYWMTGNKPKKKKNMRKIWEKDNKILNNFKFELKDNYIYKKRNINYTKKTSYYIDLKRYHFLSIYT